MSTPDFVPQNDSNFTAIRYYTAQDPYFYTVDNRPLQDIETNLKADRSGGSDAGRRAALLGSLNLASILSDYYAIPTYSSAVRSMGGLQVSTPTANSITIGPGAVYESRQVSTTVTDVIMKQALMTKSVTFNLTPPVTAGTSIVYTIEGTFVELTQSNMASTQLPNLDSSNTYLPSTLTHGELVLSVNAGTAATTGTQVPPSTTAGKFPIYNITFTQGVTNPTVALHSSGPWARSMFDRITPVALASGGATVGVTNEMPTVTFADGSTTGIMLPTVGGSISQLNPFKAIKLKLVFASTASSGNVVFRLRYGGFTTSDLITATLTTGSNEAIAITGSANAVQTYTTATAIVPNTVFAGFNGNSVWSVIKDKVNIILERVGGDASDTNTGSVVLLSTTLLQP
jgi:hypothetical protein